MGKQFGSTGPTADGDGGAEGGGSGGSEGEGGGGGYSHSSRLQGAVSRSATNAAQKGKGRGANLLWVESLDVVRQRIVQDLALGGVLLTGSVILCLLHCAEVSKRHSLKRQWTDAPSTEQPLLSDSDKI